MRGVQFAEFIEAGTPDIDLLRGIIDTRNGPTTAERWKGKFDFRMLRAQKH
jgi:hypothetical protein